ncbi:asparaginase [Pseudooctadecabacter jejudonensis]|uniref:L-asparaginase II n=1 Tax=Pseudooctadecabacter jejudonensis TaxID=1391910 RepID=A0A1Y5S6B5_9RHOB|nr:asparaginase [Pseudooctadecabacter jejudonensis]SLN31102.1 L-asparaginase II [Pseudooctadecabacter jejudonensis]
MTGAVDLVELWRGGRLESVHQGHAVVMNGAGEVVESWGNPDHVTYPRSSAKIIQALPMVESGVADRMGLTQAHLALSCASHSGAAIHTDPVQRWLDDLGLNDDAFRCGPQWPSDLPARNGLVKTDDSPCRYHNNCSGKHAGFLTMVAANGWGPEYVEADHPLQQVIKTTFEEVCENTSPGWGIDGCSAPNHAMSMRGVAHAMARFAVADDSTTRGAAMVRLREATMAHPALVANVDRACTHLMQAGKGAVSVKTGAEGYFIAIIPGKGLGVALKIMDGGTRASECAMAAILCRLGVLDKDDPLVSRYRNPDLKNFAGLVTGDMRPAAALASV